MARNAVALLTGIVFGLGLAISEMVNPAKVLAFLDLAGNWDPSLAFVMAGAVGVGLIGFRLARGRPAPTFDTRFHTNDSTRIDRALVAGAAIFGIGWGMVGVCPGPALASLAYGQGESLTFLAAMVAGALAVHLVPRPALAPSP
jgi:uncharacterized membrane protein YedE/YeeE